MLLPGYRLAYIDESGSFGYSFDRPNTSEYFVICSVIAEQCHVMGISDEIEAIRQTEFGGKELKSSSVGGDIAKRFRILQGLLALPFSVMVVVIDKKRLYRNRGLDYKSSFIKYTNSMLHLALKKRYKSLEIVSDEYGSPEFMTGFQKYVRNKGSLFSPYEFRFEKSSQCNLLQLADFVCGTIAMGYKHDTPAKYEAFLNHLREKIIYRQVFPREFSDYLVDGNYWNDTYDQQISKWCIRLATLYVEERDTSLEPLEVDRSVVVERLLFQLDVYPEAYINTDELKRLLQRRTGRSYSTQEFRSDIIGSLRDAGVVISSSTKGYKIPLNLNEVYSYGDKTMQVVYPMLERLRKCRQSILLATENQLDIMDIPEYQEIKAYFDFVKGDGHIVGKRIQDINSEVSLDPRASVEA